MNSPETQRSVEQLVPADERGSSCPPAVGQRPVPAELCALEAALMNLAEALVSGAPTIDGPTFSEMCQLFGKLNVIVAAQRHRTHIGGNDKLSDGGGKI